MIEKPVLFTKEILIDKLKEIESRGWIPNTARRGNSGAVGNLLEDLLGIDENNLPIPNAAEWELKAQRTNTTSLTTLFHMEPSPRAVRFVPALLLPVYGWEHKESGAKYPVGEMSFRQTIRAGVRSSRGFSVEINRKQKKVLVSFDPAHVDITHKDWLDSVMKRGAGKGELNPQPYWGFNDLEHKAGTKLLNKFYVQAERKLENGIEFFRYSKVMMLQKFKFEGFLAALEEGLVLVDFDARTGHNHGTKFRMRQNSFPMMYEDIITII